MEEEKKPAFSHSARTEDEQVLDFTYQWREKGAGSMMISFIEYENISDWYKAQVYCSYHLSGAHFWQGSVRGAGEPLFTLWGFSHS